MATARFRPHKRTGSRRGRSAARIVTRIGWVILPSLPAGPGGGSDRPGYKDENRQRRDCDGEQQPASESGFVHSLCPLVENRDTRTIYKGSKYGAKELECGPVAMKCFEGQSLKCYVDFQGPSWEGPMGHRKISGDLFIDRRSGIADRNEFIYKKRTGNRRGRPIARIVTRIGWAKLSCSVAGPGGGSGRPGYEHEERQNCDSYRQCQPAHESGFVHPLSPFAQNVKLKHEYRKQIPCQKITSSR